LAAAIASGAFACYSPNVASGGFFCSDAGACPEGFRCMPDRKCYKPDSGPEVRMCMDAAPITSACDEGPASGQACNPTCQKGCLCNDRCTVVGNNSTCKAGGSKALGTACNVNDDDCAPGLGCVRECGSGFGRCFQFCRSAADCAIGNCDVPVGSQHMACEVRAQTCDPVGAAAATSCPHPALGCYVSGGTTICDCPGSGQPDGPCTIFNSCAPGYQCLQRAGDPGPRCRQVCHNSNDCAAPTPRCEPAGAFGFCAA
jgi:hypothetical protein